MSCPPPLLRPHRPKPLNIHPVHQIQFTPLMSARIAVVHKPLLAVVVALFISTVGVATSLFSILLLWLVPTWTPTPPQYRPRPSRVPPHLEPPPNPPAILLRKSAASKPASPRLSLASVNSRRVSFDLAMSQTTLSTNVTRRANKAGPPPSYAADQPEPPSPTAPESSTSTLVGSLSSKPETYPESADESNLDSDSSHLSSVSSLQRRSLSIAAHLPSVKNVFLKRANRRSPPPSSLSINSLDSDLLSLKSPSRPETPKSARRSMQIWSTTRRRRDSTASDAVAEGQPTPTPRSAKRFSLPAMRPCTPTSFFFKSDCQSPTPVPRTQPYGPPYYAPTPTSVDATFSYRARASRRIDSVDDDASSVSSANSGWKRPATPIGYGPPPRSARRAGDDWNRNRSHS